MSEESIKNPTESDNTFAPNLINPYSLPGVKLGGDCLINSNISFFRKVINLYISYTLDTRSRDLDTDFTLGKCLFGAVNLTKNPDPDKFGYNGYVIGFDSRLQFSLSDGTHGINMLLFLKIIIVLLCMLVIKIKIY